MRVILVRVCWTDSCSSEFPHTVFQHFNISHMPEVACHIATEYIGIEIK
jgi:hypothetical protein